MDCHWHALSENLYGGKKGAIASGCTIAAFIHPPLSISAFLPRDEKKVNISSEQPKIAMLKQTNKKMQCVSLV